MEALLPILVIGGIIAAVGAIIVYARHAAKKRREAIIEHAEVMGLTFFPDGDPNLLERLSLFKLFNQGHGRKMMNLIQGDSGEVKIAIFDYQYTTGGGKNQQTHLQSIVALQSYKLLCPDFTMRPERMFDKLGAVLGLQDIDFKSNPAFSTMYLLKGDDEQQIRDFFDDGILSVMEKKQKLCVEAVPKKMIVYYANRPPRADQLKSLFAEALEIYSVFDERAKSMPKQTQDASNANHRFSS